MQDITTDGNYQAMVSLFAQGSGSTTERQSMLNDPLGALKSIGITVDERHRDAVEQSLRAVLFAQTPQTGGPTKAKRAQSDFEKYVHISLELWGVVVQIDHEAINQLPRGMKAIEPLAEGIGAAMLASKALGPAALVVLGSAVLWGAVITAYVLILPEIDRGKGIYLTITHPQIAMAIASGGLLGAAMIPIPTAVV